jgi:hypothetical protein
LVVGRTRNGVGGGSIPRVWTRPEEYLILCDGRIRAGLESVHEVLVQVQPGDVRISIDPSLRVWLCSLEERRKRNKMMS